MASVIINGIAYSNTFTMNNIKETFWQIYRKYNSDKDKNRFFTIISAMVLSAQRDLDLKGNFDDGYKYIYDKIKDYDMSPPLCVVCKKNKVEWNKQLYKYNRICNDPACKAKANEAFKVNAKAKLGTDNPAADPNHQIAMQQGRSIAKEYVFKDGGVKTVLGMQEYSILEALENCGLTSAEIEAPGPTFLYYHPILKKNLAHISDIFIPKYNLIISGKDGVENPNMHPNIRKDRLRAIYEYIHILHKTEYNFVQVEGKEDIKEIPTIIKTVSEMHSKGARYIVPPRVDLAYGESNRIYESPMRYYFLLDDDGSVIISFFTFDKYSAKGLIVFESDVAIYDVSFIFKNPLLRANLFYVELEYDPMMLRRDKVNLNIENNHQMFIYAYTGIVPDTSTYESFHRNIYIVDIREITNKIRVVQDIVVDGFMTHSKNSILPQLKYINKHNNPLENTDSSTPKDHNNRFNIDFYFVEDKYIRFSVFNKEIIYDINNGMVKVREGKVNKKYNGCVKVTYTAYLLFYALMSANIGISRLSDIYLHASEIGFDISDILLILIKHMLYSTDNIYTKDICMSVHRISNLDDIEKEIALFLDYRFKAVIYYDKEVYERDIVDVEQYNDLNTIRLCADKNNKIIKQFTDKCDILVKLNKFKNMYKQTNKKETIISLIQ